MVSFFEPACKYVLCLQGMDIHSINIYAVFVVSSFCSDTVKSCLAMIGVYKSPPFLSLMQLAMKTVTGCGIF